VSQATQSSSVDDLRNKARELGLTLELYNTLIDVECCFTTVLKQGQYDVLIEDFRAASRNKNFGRAREIKQCIADLDFKPTTSPPPLRADVLSRAQILSSAISEYQNELTNALEIEQVELCQVAIDRVQVIIGNLMGGECESPCPSVVPVACMIPNAAAKKNSSATTLQLAGCIEFGTRSSGQSVLMDGLYVAPGVNHMQVKAKLSTDQTTLRAEYERLRILSRTV
jgi:hypothetical protein